MNPLGEIPDGFIVKTKGLEQNVKGIKITPLNCTDFTPGSCVRNLQNRPKQVYTMIVSVDTDCIGTMNGAQFTYEALAKSLYEYWTPVTKRWLPCTKEATVEVMNYLDMPPSRVAEIELQKLED